MIGASGPKPSIPSWTIVPGAIATSVTCDPQALLTVPMSIPWSSVQALGGSTRLSGLSGNTRAPDAGEETETGEGFGTASQLASRAGAVGLPTAPLAGARRLARWKVRPACLVIEPK